MNMIYTFLQIFADAGTLVNATGQYVNAYTGQGTPFDEQNSFAGEMKVFYDTELLDNARMERVYAQFAKHQKLPANHGDTVEFRKFNTFKKASKLTEGVIPTGQKFGMTTKTASIFQMGTYVALSDKIQTRTYDPVATEAVHEMSASMYETQETLIRDALLGNTNVLYADNVTIATGEVESTPTTPATMEDTTAIKCFITDKTVHKVATIMKKNKVPKINGSYVWVIHPSCAEDLTECKGWKDPHEYSSPSEIWNGEIGKLHGIRFVENPDAPILKGEYANAAGGATYASYVFGLDAFAIIDPEQGGAETIIKNKEEIGGPLNQFSTVGYKFEHGSAVLYPERMLRVMSCSSYSATDETNYDPDFYPEV